ncbi:hypothetical protein NHX12_023685 [Muraenolepis orangiensis]|uniref:Uncharacterized protein n=1 Tax=Muraenolepis orangiensis TaxID=630683 RepID=A0A9Q0IU19_9TELE|nr:hypothetical protein NHX12_023685 [Muraenolepis orangiensis]
MVRHFEPLLWALKKYFFKPEAETVIVNVSSCPCRILLRPDPTVSGTPEGGMASFLRTVAFTMVTVERGRRVRNPASASVTHAIAMRSGRRPIVTSSSPCTMYK